MGRWIPAGQSCEICNSHDRRHHLGDQLDLMIRARTALIWIRSNEEARVEALLRQTATRLQHQLAAGISSTAFKAF